MTVRDGKRGGPKHPWSEYFPIVLHRMCEGVCGWNPVAAGIEFQLANELQFLSLSFALRHARYRSEYFCFTLSFFLTGNIHPVLGKAVEEAEKEFSKTVDPRAWSIFKDGTPEEQDAFQDEVLRSFSEDCQDTSGQADRQLGAD
jgi:hypothetical protein